MSFGDILSDLKNGSFAKYNGLIIKVVGTDFFNQNQDLTWSNCNSKLSPIDFLSPDWSLYHEPRNMTFNYKIDSFTPVINVSEDLLNGNYSVTIKEIV